MAVEVLTFGCRLNAAESDEIRRHAVAAGHRDLVVVNTCAVTAEAARQAGRAIRRTIRDRPGARIAVTGCASEIDRIRFAAMPGVTAVVPNAEKTHAATWAALPGSGAADATAAAPDPGRTRALVPVQTGCDHRCTFCIIPFGRGPSRSVSLATVIADVQDLVAAGAREVVLTGLDITSYGADLPGAPRLGTLVQAVLRAVPALDRLRLSSIDSIEADDDLLAALAEPRFMPHLHLSLQAGDDMVLTRMKRRHRRADAIRFCEAARRLRPDIVFGADLIAGFPTETDAMFARSLALVADCGLTYLHVFPYSPRPGTPAARMPPVRPEIARERAARLREAGRVALARHLAGEVGRTRRVLTERGGTGRTEAFAPVRFARPVRAGEILDVALKHHDGSQLWAC